jgi:hypothetical protein
MILRELTSLLSLVTYVFSLAFSGSGSSRSSSTNSSSSKQTLTAAAAANYQRVVKKQCLMLTFLLHKIKLSYVQLKRKRFIDFV